MQAIFLIGEQRSGSNLLRLMVSGSGAIAAPHPPHILQRIDPIVPVAEMLDDERFEALIETVCELVETNPVPWAHTVLDREDIARRCREQHVIAIFGAVMDVHAEANGARAWMCKSMQNVRWAAALDRYFRTNKWLFLHRDPRDVALSFTKAVIGDKHVYFLAKQWQELQRLCLDARAGHGAERFASVGYRELTEDAETTLRRLCAFLGVELAFEMLDFQDSDEARNTASASSLWENVARPLMRGDHGKFLEELADEEVRVIESIAGREMDELRYERLFIRHGEEEHYGPDRVAGFKRINERLKKLRVETMDAADAQRRKRQDAVLQELKENAAEWKRVAVARAS